MRPTRPPRLKRTRPGIRILTSKKDEIPGTYSSLNGYETYNRYLSLESTRCVRTLIIDVNPQNGYFIPDKTCF